nr:MazG-like family protein [Micromonospora sp. DSM 115978]
MTRETSLDLSSVFEMVTRFKVLDEAAALSRSELLAGRVLKVSEEVGEAAQAYIGMTGRNPRKGVSHTEADLASELCDVVLAAMVALATLEDGWTARLQAHLSAVAARTLRATDGAPDVAAQ